MTIKPNRPGRQSKGDREPTTVRAPRAHMSIYRAEASERGMPLGDYLAFVLADAHGLDAPHYSVRGSNQPPLLTG